MNFSSSTQCLKIMLMSIKEIGVTGEMEARFTWFRNSYADNMYCVLLAIWCETSQKYFCHGGRGLKQTPLNHPQD